MRNEFLNEFHTERRKKPADRSFLILLFVFGVICLTVTKGWYVYADPLKDGGEWLVSKIGGAGKEDTTLAKNDSKTSKTDRDRNGAQSGNAKRGDDGNNGSEAGSFESGESGGEDFESSEPEDGNLQTSEHESGDPDSDNFEGGDPEPEPQTAFTFVSVEDDYFADAVFIGDSRTVGLQEYGGLQEVSTFYAATGLSVHKLFTSKIVTVPDSKNKITVEEALSERQFAKVYLMIGINEMGTGTAESFLAKYEESVQHIRELQPDAVIYLQSIMQISQKRDAKGDSITIEGIDIRNEGIRNMADNEHIFYLDVNEAVCGEDGALIADYTNDGVHLKAQYVSLWKDYLKSHAVLLPDED